MSDRLPNAVDRHVASRLRLRRLEAGLTQTMLADKLGISFQQLQKYEGAVNRASHARRLVRCGLNSDRQRGRVTVNERLKDHPLRVTFVRASLSVSARIAAIRRGVVLGQPVGRRAFDATIEGGSDHRRVEPSFGVRKPSKLSGYIR